jgi:hypothetical protein
VFAVWAFFLGMRQMSNGFRRSPGASLRPIINIADELSDRAVIVGRNHRNTINPVRSPRVVVGFVNAGLMSRCRRWASSGRQRRHHRHRLDHRGSAHQVRAADDRIGAFFNCSPNQAQ